MGVRDVSCRAVVVAMSLLASGGFRNGAIVVFGSPATHRSGLNSKTGALRFQGA